MGLSRLITRVPSGGVDVDESERGTVDETGLEVCLSLSNLLHRIVLGIARNLIECALHLEGCGLCQCGYVGVVSVSQLCGGRKSYYILIPRFHGLMAAIFVLHGCIAINYDKLGEVVR